MALTDDDSAADSLPVALAGTVILIAIIVSLTAFGIRNATPSVEIASVDRQVNEVANECRFLLSQAPRQLDDSGSPPGAMGNVELDLPEDTEYLSFGYDPEAKGGHRGTIYYKVGGTKKAVVVDEQMSFKNTVTLSSGRYNLLIEYASDSLNRRFLLVSSPG
jgi:hypothetical protein